MPARVAEFHTATLYAIFRLDHQISNVTTCLAATETSQCKYHYILFFQRSAMKKLSQKSKIDKNPCNQFTRDKYSASSDDSSRSLQIWLVVPVM